ncbi:TetR-like C-terminal domain-containing protein [Streptomyces sp. NPDC094034]|uniref:TetR/AcrR family transcriptional regulator n=1 Tax=Streptomyces sp. NPDC094034 TaxID=3155309 RepID=UPI00332E848E
MPRSRTGAGKSGIRAGLSPAAVVDAALATVDEQGPAALTLAAVAARTGVAVPSLYKHVKGLPELRLMLVKRVFGELAERLRDAALGRSGDDAVAAVLHAYRDYARAHPGRYALLPQGAGPQASELGAEVVKVIFAALRGYGLADADLVHATRCLRAAAHGFAALETAGAFGLPDSVDASHDHLVTTFTSGLATAFRIGG